MKKHCFILLLVGCSWSLFAQKPQDFRVEATFNQQPLTGILSSLQKQYPLRFYYQENWLQGITVNGSFNDSLTDFLDKVLEGTAVSYRVFRDRQIIFLSDEPQEPLSATTIPQDIDSALQSSAEARRVIGSGNNEKGTISGYVREANTGEAIIGASIYVEELADGTVTNQFGFYSLTLPRGTYRLIVSYIGWEEEYVTVEVSGSGNLEFELFEETVRLEGVTITEREQDANISSVQMNTAKLDIATIKSRPAFLGEVDVIKSIQLLPGVSTVGEGTRGFNVRGGSVGDNLILLEGAPVFNSSHVFGFFSIFNSDVVKEATLYKGSIPAKFGERVASVLEVNLKEGNVKNWQAKGGLGIVSSRIAVEGPTVKDKGSVVIGARASYSNWVLNQVKDIDIRESQASFYDANVKLTHQFDEKNKLSLSTYLSRDRFKFADDTLYKYQNNLASLSWKHVFKDQWFSNITASYSDYSYDVDGLQTGQKYNLKSGVKYAGLRLDLSYFPSLKHKIDFGANGGHYRLAPGNFQPLESNSLLAPVILEDEKSLEASAYISDEWQINEKLTLLAGLRYSWYRQLGPGTDLVYNPEAPLSPSSAIDTLIFDEGETMVNYQGFEPRFSLKYSTGPHSSVKLSYQRIRQNLHLISNSAAITPFDIWKTSDRFLPPQISDQFSVGFFKNFLENTWETSVEIYYRYIDNVPQYKNQAEILLNPTLETDVIVGNGRAYGAEFLVRKDLGRFTGWLSYTLSRTERKAHGPFPEEQINQGAYYRADYDRPHDFTSVLSYKISRRWLFAANFTYSTGRPISVPESRYRLFGISIAQFTERNQYRIPDYHRLDLSITLEGNHKKNKKWEGSWTFTVFNVYGRKNAYSIFFGTQPDSRVVDAFRLSILGSAFPALTYNFKFPK